MSVLLTILNRADPTPTARSIVSQNISNVHILVLGYDMYTDEQQSGLRRFEKWSIGSARDEHFPKDKWLDDLDWISLEDRGVNLTFHHLNSVSEFDFDILVNGASVDLFSGSKEQSGELLRLSVDACESVDFVITQLNGSTINLKTGEVCEPCNLLSINEMIWLSTGYVALFDRFGEMEIGEAVKDWPFESSPLGKNGKEVTKTKRIPKDISELKKILRVPEEDSKDGSGYWLEYYTADVLATWPGVIETRRQMHIIKPEIDEFVASAFSNMNNQDKDEMQEFDWGKIGYKPPPNPEERMERENHLLWRNKLNKTWFLETVLDESIVKIIWTKANIMDVDVVARLGNGFFILCECKDKSINKIGHQIAERISSICNTLFPPSSIPMIVHSGNKSRNNGIPEVTWSSLCEPITAMSTSEHSLLKKLLKNNPPPRTRERKRKRKNPSNAELFDLISDLFEKFDERFDKIESRLNLFLDTSEEE